MHVVKLGGGLIEVPAALREWLGILGGAGRGRVVVVPGGGPFADAVRTAQCKIGFDDRAAHRMAILAMDQYACLLASVGPALVLCASEEHIRSTLGARGVPVWLPSAMTLADASIAESWDVTSDSLAAWLARRLGASALWLVKRVATSETDPQRLSDTCVADRAFAQFCGSAPLRVRVVDVASATDFAAALDAA